MLEGDEPGSLECRTDGGLESWTGNSAVLWGSFRLGDPIGMLTSQSGSTRGTFIIAGVASCVEPQK